MRQSVAAIDVPAVGAPPHSRKQRRGTGVLVGERLVLTALHVITEDDDDPEQVERIIELCFDDGQRLEAKIVPGMWSREDDWALLECERAPGLPALPCSDQPLQKGCGWEAYGFPDMAPAGTHLTGTIIALDGHYNGAQVFNLLVDQLVGKGGRPAGVSGAPCIVDGAVVALIRSGLHDGDGYSVGATLYAAPMAKILERAGAKISGLSSLDFAQGLPADPYPGLEPYTAAHAATFFGRNKDIKRLFEELTGPSRGVVLLYGASGVGKSSLLEAGLVPRLKATCGVFEERRSADKELSPCLENALARAAKAQGEGTVEGSPPPIVVIDQVEEVFARTRAEANAEMSAFVDALVMLFQWPGPPRFRLLLSFRKEWYADIKARLDSKGILCRSHLLEPLEEAGIHEVVHGLTYTSRLRSRYGRTVEKGLGKRIADQLLARDRESPVAPTLALVMQELWKKSSPGDELTIAAFDQIRRDWTMLGEFIQRQIDELRKGALADLVDSGLVEDILLAHTTQARYAMSVATLCRADDLRATYPQLLPDDKFEALLEALKDAHLLTGVDGSATRLSHDTLAPLVFARWHQSEAPGPRARRFLEWWTREWKRDGKELRALDSAALAEVERGRQGMRVLTADEQQLLDISRDARDKQEQEQKRRERREATGRRLLVTLGFSLAFAGVIAARNGCVANENAEELRARSLQDTVQILAAHGGDNLQTAALVAVELLKDDHWTPEADKAARAILEQMALPDDVKPLEGELDYIKSSIDIDYLITAVHQPGTEVVSTRNVANRASIDRFEISTGSKRIAGLNLSTDGKLLAIKSSSHYWLRNLETGKTDEGVEIPTSGSVLFSKNNRWMAATCSTGLCLYAPPSADPWVTIPAYSPVDFQSETIFSTNNEDLLIHRTDEGVSFFNVAARTYAAPTLLLGNIGASRYSLLRGDLLAAYPQEGDDWSLWQVDDDHVRPLDVPAAARPARSVSSDGRLFVTSPRAGTVQVDEIDETGHIEPQGEISIGHEYSPLTLSHDKSFILSKASRDVRVFSSVKGTAFGRVLHDADKVAISRSAFTTAGDARLVTWAFPGHQDDHLYRILASQQSSDNFNVSSWNRFEDVVMLPSRRSDFNVWMPGRNSEELRLRTDGKVALDAPPLDDPSRIRTWSPDVSKDGESMVIADSHRIAAFRLPSGELLWSFPLPVAAGGFSRPDGSVEEWLVVASREDRERLFGFKESEEEVLTFDSKLPSAQHLPPSFFVRRHLHIAVRGEDELPSALSLQPIAPTAIAISPHGERVAFALYGHLWVFDTRSQARMAYHDVGYIVGTSVRERLYTSRINDLLFDASGQGLGILTMFGTLWQWDGGQNAPAPRKQIADFGAYTYKGHQHFFGQDRRTLCVTSWNGDQQSTFSGVIDVLSTSRDDARFATSEYGIVEEGSEKPRSAVVVWSLSTGAPLHKIVVEDDDPMAALSWDGTRIAIKHTKGDIDVWDISAGRARLIAKIPQQEHTWYRFGFVNRDLLWTIAYNAEGVHLHPIGKDKLREEICYRSIRNLTDAEWARFFPDTKRVDTCELRWGKSAQ